MSDSRPRSLICVWIRFSFGATTQIQGANRGLETDVENCAKYKPSKDSLDWSKVDTNKRGFFGGRLSRCLKVVSYVLVMGSTARFRLSRHPASEKIKVITRQALLRFEIPSIRRDGSSHGLLKAVSRVI